MNYWLVWIIDGGGGGVLPHSAKMAMCRWTGYGFLGLEYWTGYTISLFIVSCAGYVFAPEDFKLFAHGNFAEKRVLKLVQPFCGLYLLVGKIWGKAFRIFIGLDERKGRWIVEQDFLGNFRVNHTWFFAFFSCLFDCGIVLILVFFKTS